MKQLKFYMVAKCSADAAPEEFDKSLCTIVYKKKDIKEYILKRAIIDSWEHYSRWLPCQNKEDSSESQKEYIDLVLGGEFNIISQYSCKRVTFTAEAIASLMRIMNHCVPVGAPYETELEVKTIDNFFNTLIQICAGSQEQLKELNNEDKEKVEIKQE